MGCGTSVHSSFTGETLCGLLVPWFHGTALHYPDILLLVDSEAAVASLIRGSSTQFDVHTLVQIAQYLIFVPQFSMVVAI